jgi:hypothetical protein
MKNFNDLEFKQIAADILGTSIERIFVEPFFFQIPNDYQPRQDIEKRHGVIYLLAPTSVVNPNLIDVCSMTFRLASVDVYDVRLNGKGVSTLPSLIFDSVVLFNHTDDSVQAFLGQFHGLVAKMF